MSPVPPVAEIAEYWAIERDQLFEALGSNQCGLSSAAAADRRRTYGPNRIEEKASRSPFETLLAQLRNPLLGILLFAAVLSAFTREWVDACIVLIILLTSVAIGYRRERQAETAALALRARLHTRVRALRDGAVQDLPHEELVPGDVVLLSAGTLIPADGVLLEATDLFVNQAVLTGESFPVQKGVGTCARHASVAERTNCVFSGTNVRSGGARSLIVNTGRRAEFGRIAHRLVLRPPETEFDRGVRHFGYLLSTVMLVLALTLFGVFALQGRPVVETLLFSVALAVGLSPELLPAILSVNLARGAERMAERKVLVRRLSAIENLGSMDVLCTDKTGTLTRGVVALTGSYDAFGVESREILEIAAQNAALQAGLANPLDEAILKAHEPALGPLRKLAEVPFDFVRKRVSVAVESRAGRTLITKGAFQPVLEICSHVAGGDLNETTRRRIAALHAEFSGRGVRVLALATRPLPEQESYDRSDERDLTFRGLLTFADEIKPDVERALAELRELGVSVKIITGDSRLVAEHVARSVGIARPRTLTGHDLDELHDEALWHRSERTDLFVEVDPNQKERIILSLKKMGHVVGFLGDGINDAPAMHAADASLSVEQAVDVARETADFVLLDRELHVIRDGIREGRHTFANTLKYVLTTTSANLGNMLSMAAASVFLPFLPLTAGQILLNNFLSDIPAIGIASDTVDPELVAEPRRWDMGFISRFMLEFGLLSSLFDLLTFAALLWVFRAGVAEFRTAWFVESLLTELVIALIVRTRRLAFRSRPGRVLLWSTVALGGVTLAIPYLPGSSWLGFVPLPASVMLTIAAIAATYAIAAEFMKGWFYRRAA